MKPGWQAPRILALHYTRMKAQLNKSNTSGTILWPCKLKDTEEDIVNGYPDSSNPEKTGPSYECAAESRKPTIWSMVSTLRERRCIVADPSFETSYYLILTRRSGCLFWNQVTALSVLNLTNQYCPHNCLYYTCIVNIITFSWLNMFCCLQLITNSWVILDTPGHSSISPLFMSGSLWSYIHVPAKPLVYWSCHVCLTAPWSHV